jgi:hypothetical protein
MTEFARGFVKLVLIPVGYTAAGPFMGLYRGVTGKNSPLDYDRLVSTYPIKAGPYSHLKTHEEFWKCRGVGDDPAIFGILFSDIGATATAAIPWAVTKAVRVIGKEFLYELPKEIFTNTKHILKPEK